MHDPQTPQTVFAVLDAQARLDDALRSPADPVLVAFCCPPAEVAAEVERRQKAIDEARAALDALRAGAN